MSERFQPPVHVAPDTAFHALLFRARLLGDFQLNTIYKHMKQFLPGVTGKLVDIGAGQSPFKHLLSERAVYVGIDIHGAESFGYKNDQIIQFDGRHIPFDDGAVDSFICTEVLEHVEDAQTLVNEMYRILRPGGKGVVTIPWSARYHYIPFDYHRFTPSRLHSMFVAFSSVSVVPRGTDITVIVSKLIVVYLRLLTPARKLWLPISIVAAIALSPLIVLCVVVGHVSLFLRIGSIDDPLGYTVWTTK